MRKLKTCLALLALLLSAFTTISVAQRKTVLIAGRAVDEQGVPISGAIVALDTPPCRNCIDHVIPATSSLSEGEFFIDSAGMSTKALTLYITERVPNGFWSPLPHPPFVELSHLPAYQGTPVPVEKGKISIDLGDVVVRFRYSKVMVELTEIFGEQYEPGQGASGLVSLTLQDDQGKAIYQGRLPGSAFDPTFSFLNLALTGGKWTMVFHLDSQDQKIQTAPLLINIEKPSCMIVTLSEGRLRRQQCN